MTQVIKLNNYNLKLIIINVKHVFYRFKTFDKTTAQLIPSMFRKHDIHKAVENINLVIMSYSKIYNFLSALNANTLNNTIDM